MSIRQLLEDIMTLRQMPRVTVNLMYGATAGNDPFYERVAREFYAQTRKHHRQFFWLRDRRYGVALCELPKSFDEYFMTIEAAGRRNYKKAQRMGYHFEKIQYNDHLKTIREIHASTDVRQGRMPEHVLAGEVRPNTNPPSKTRVHDYPYFGIFNAENKLVAYSADLVCGELFQIEQLYGHADYQADGVVPMLIIGMAGYMLGQYPGVKYYVYEMFFGASTTMRRFKRKFGFTPHRVEWVLG